MNVAGYLGILQREYFSEYLPRGGSAFKLVIVPDRTTALNLFKALDSVAGPNAFRRIRLCAAEAKLHLMDKLFFALARTIDWDSEVQEFIRNHIVHSADRCVNDGVIDLGRVAERTARSQDSVRKDIGEAIRQVVSQDYGFCAEFRVALTHLCLSQMSSNGSLLSTHGPNIKAWLRGELPSIVALRGALVFQKIQRNNARHMLYSTFRLLRKCGYAGTVIILDIARYMEIAKKVDRADGCYYSYNAVLELYELLRQFIDDLQELESTMIVVVSPREILTDDRRCLDRYQALKMRIWSDVRVRSGQNPLAPMITMSQSNI